MNRKTLNIIIMILVSLLLTGCEGLKTPEELIQPPELNVEKKQLNDALLSFLPQNSDLIVLPYAKGVKNENSIINRDIDSDSDEEAIALYRDKNTRKLGLIVLDKANDIWVKKTDIKLEAFEISDYRVLDLDNDGMEEVIIGYYGITNPYKEINIYKQEKNSLKSVFSGNYLAMEVLDADDDGIQDIAISNFGNTDNNNSMSILNLVSGQVVKVSEIIYPKEKEIYSITFGKINDKKKGFFVDMYVKQNYGETDVLVYKDKELKSIIKDSDISSVVQSTPIKSADVDDDGIIEVAKMQFIDKYDEGKSPNSYVKNYYKIDEDIKLKLVTQLYEDTSLNVNINFPISFKDNFFIQKDNDESGIWVYFSPKDQTGGIPFMLIKKIEKANLESQLGEYQLISETDEMAIIAKVIDKPDGLSSRDRNIYEKMQYDSRDLTLIIKPANY
ncbi:MAG: hypothetical protein ACRC76_06515 [Proteocatella sp.]